MTEVKIRMNKDGAFEVNENLAGLVPMASESEQAVLTADIQANEQRDPIVLWRGKVIDGRCRQKALVMLGKHILYKELDDKLTEDEARVYVKSVNSRRNLTATQKVMSACRESLRPEEARPLDVIAKSWGIGRELLNNARYMAKIRPEFVERLFNGETVEIATSSNEKKFTNKITTIYAYLKRETEQVKEDISYAWKADSYIKTQAGKEWYYEQVAMLDNDKDNMRVRILLQELANYKFIDGAK